MLAVNIPNLLPDDIFGFHFSWMHPAGRLIWSTLLLLVGVGVIVFLAKRPKAPEPPTWAQAMLGAIVVFALMLLAYGTVPHEWIVFANSYHDFSAANYVIEKNRFIRFDIDQQALNDAVLQVQLHDVVVNSFRRVENDGADGRLLAPLEIARALFRRGAQRVERYRPSWVSAVANIEVGENKTSGRIRRCSSLLQRFRTKQFERTGKRIAKLIVV